MIALQEMNLARFYPIIFWNTANLIVDSGGIQVENEDNNYDEEEEIEDTIEQQNLEEYYDEQEEWEEEYEVIQEEKEEDKKDKVKNIDYGKVASVIGRFNDYGIKVSPPNINSSSFTFTPVVENNEILYGLRGIARLSSSIIKTIIKERPFTSMEDFLNRIKLNKIQMSNLIKCGAFDELMHISRQDIMQKYIESITEKKQRLTLQNMQMLIDKELIPEDMIFYAKLFSFNKYLKSCKNDIYYELNEAAINFIIKHFSVDLIDNGNMILQKIWDNLYKKSMEPMRIYLKDNKEEMLNKLNNSLFKEIWNKYALGNISHWEMESVSFYSHEHELALIQNQYDDFFQLSEEPKVEYSFYKNDTEIKVFKLYKIIGTVIDKNKLKNMITLLTPTGVVNVKIYKNQYALYDKQLSIKGEDGHKHVLEKSWFSRGTLLMIQGMRRGADFIPKKRKDSPYPVISKITSVNNDGTLTFQFERMEVDE